MKNESRKVLFLVDRQVLSTTIVNCWRKADIIEKTNNNVLNELVINIELDRSINVNLLMLISINKIFFHKPDFLLIY